MHFSAILSGATALMVGVALASPAQNVARSAAASTVSVTKTTTATATTTVTTTASATCSNSAIVADLDALDGTLVVLGNDISSAIVNLNALLGTISALTQAETTNANMLTGNLENSFALINSALATLLQIFESIDVKDPVPTLAA